MSDITDAFPNGTKCIVINTNSPLDGTFVIVRGIATVAQAIIGRTYIVELSLDTNIPSYPYPFAAILNVYLADMPSFNEFWDDGEPEQ